jgi:hypothetical protein
VNLLEERLLISVRVLAAAGNIDSALADDDELDVSRSNWRILDSVDEKLPMLGRRKESEIANEIARDDVRRCRAAVRRYLLWVEVV